MTPSSAPPVAKSAVRSSEIAQGASGQAVVRMDVPEAAAAQDLHQLRVGVGHACTEPEAGREQLRRVVDPRQTLVEGLPELLEGVDHCRLEQLRLGVEVVVEGAEADVRALGDRLDARAGVAALGEYLPGRSHEGSTGLGAAPLEAVAGRG